MFINIMLAISVAIFILSVIRAIVLIKKQKLIKSNLIASFILSIGLAMFPLYLLGNVNATGGVFDMLASSFLGVVRAVTGENSLSDTRNMVQAYENTYGFFISNYTALLHLIFSFLVLGFIAGLFKNFFAKFTFKYIASGKLYVFSNCSKRSLLLAQDIKKQCNGNCTIVFLDELDIKNSEHSEILQSVALLDGYVFNTGLQNFKICKRFFKNDIYFFLLKQNEEDNLKDALILHDVYVKHTKPISTKGNHVFVYLLNSYDETIAVIDALERYDGNIKTDFRIINEKRALIFDLFDKNPLFLSAHEASLEVLIIGGGKTGTAAAEIAAWCGQTVKLKPKIVVVDNSDTWIKHFEYKCPELSLNTKSQLALKESQIEFHNADVLSCDFEHIIKAHPNVGYVICALGDNELNIKTALKFAQAYEKTMYLNGTDYVSEHLSKLQIHLLIDDAFLANISKELKFDNKNSCNLKPFGNLSDIYTFSNIVSPYLNSLGMEINRFYTKDYMKHEIESASGENKKAIITKVEKEADENYNSKEYNRISSISAGLHLKYKAYSALVELMGIEYPNEVWKSALTPEMTSKLQETLKKDDIVEQLSILEHRRWNVYMRANGWQHVSTEIADTFYGKNKNTWRNFTAKLTTCLVSWDELDSIDKWMLEKHGEVKNFKEVDRVLVRNIADILKNARVNEII